MNTASLTNTDRISKVIGIHMRNFLETHDPEQLTRSQVLAWLDQVDKNRLPAHSWGNIAALFQMIEMKSNGKASATHIVNMCRLKATCQI